MSGKGKLWERSGEGRRGAVTPEYSPAWPCGTGVWPVACGLWVHEVTSVNSIVPGAEKCEMYSFFFVYPRIKNKSEVDKCLKEKIPKKEKLSRLTQTHTHTKITLLSVFKFLRGLLYSD